MKKLKPLALAALATAALSAQAQSSVTLYGVVDAAVGPGHAHHAVEQQRVVGGLLGRHGALGEPGQQTHRTSLVPRRSPRELRRACPP